MSDEQAELRRLRWRCRRGMRELDQLMLRYVDHAWCSDSADERMAFERLLECEDDQLWRWFIGRLTADDAELERLVRRILTLPN